VVVASRAGVPFGIRLDSASPAEVNMLEPVMDEVKLRRRGRPIAPQRIIVDRGYDADWLRWQMAKRGIEMICPHRRGRVKSSLQDGRALRRYQRRWIVERTIAWLTNYRRILVRHDHNLKMYKAFVHVACMLIALRQF
jgi:transposase